MSGKPKLLIARIGAIDNDHRGGATFPPKLVAELTARRYECFFDFSHWPVVRWLAQQLSSIPVRAATHEPEQDALLRIPPPQEEEAAARVPDRPSVSCLAIHGMADRKIRWSALP